MLTRSRSRILLLALVAALGVAHSGCDKLGLGGKEESKAKKVDDDDDDAPKKKKKKKKNDEGAESSSASASALASAAPSAAPSAISPDSTGIPECDAYVASFARCIPDSAEAAKKLHAALKQGAVTAREQMIQTCTEGVEGLSKACPAKAK